MQELYNEITASDEQKKAFVEAMKANKLEDFLKEHGCEATAEEGTTQGTVPCVSTPTRTGRGWIARTGRRRCLEESGSKLNAKGRTQRTVPCASPLC